MKAMKKKVVIVTLWFACGFVAVGASMAYFAAKYPTVEISYRQCLGKSSVYFFGGPLSLLVVMCTSGFMEYGWAITPAQFEARRQAGLKEPKR